jgi:hypothetical protein
VIPFEPGPDPLASSGPSPVTGVPPLDTVDAETRLGAALAWLATRAPWLRVTVRRMRRGFVHVRWSPHTTAQAHLPPDSDDAGRIARIAATVHPDLLMETDGPVSIVEWLLHPRHQTSRRRLMEAIERCQGRRAERVWRTHADWLRNQQTVGTCLDLHGEAAAVHRTGFDDLPMPEFAWARQPPARRLRHIRFGTYRAQDGGRITISPRLAEPWVATSFLRHVLHHEMCHHRQACLRIPRREGVHSARFRAWERTQPEYADAMRWESIALPWLLAGTVPPWIGPTQRHPALP